MNLRTICASLLLLAAVPTTAMCQSWTALGPGNYAEGINSLGVVTGGDPPVPGNGHFLWTPETPNGVTGSIAYGPGGSSINDLGQVIRYDRFIDPQLGEFVPPSSPFALNNVGNVLCRSTSGVSIWSVASGFTPISGLPTGAKFFTGVGATKLNDFGQLIGHVSGYPLPPQAFLWTPTPPNGPNGTYVWIGQFVPMCINDFGQVLGFSELSSDAILWTPDVPNGTAGSQVTLMEQGFMGGTVDYANSAPGLNNRGQALITVLIEPDWHQFLWSPDVWNGTTGAAFDIGGPSTNSYAGQTWGRPLNDFGQVAVSNYLWTPLVGQGPLTGAGGNDLIRGDVSDDTLDGEQGDDSLVGEGGDDTLFGGSGSDSLNGGDGGDTLEGGSGDDRLVGGAGMDILDGGQGSDTLYGGEGDDFLDVESGESEGDDTLDGGAGDDILFGGQGNDVLIGGTGDDMMFSGSGNDDIDGGPGLDVVNAGAGNDVVRVLVGDVPAGDVESVDAGPGVDSLILTGFLFSDVVWSGSTATVTDPLTGGQYVVTNLENIVFQ